jgi:hypothetical protein
MISHIFGGKRETLVLGAGFAVVENVDAVRSLWKDYYVPSGYFSKGRTKVELYGHCSAE